jgi:hypothetical protein
VGTRLANSGFSHSLSLEQMTLDCGIAHYEAELCWLEQALKRVRNLPPLTPSKTSYIEL